MIGSLDPLPAAGSPVQGVEATLKWDTEAVALPYLDIFGISSAVDFLLLFFLFTLLWGRGSCDPVLGMEMLSLLVHTLREWGSVVARASFTFFVVPLRSCSADLSLFRVRCPSFQNLTIGLPGKAWRCLL